MTTLQEAKDHLLANVEKGTHCPCCERYTKVYRRRLNAAMARYLILMVKKQGDPDGWLHVETDFRDVSVPSRGDYAKLRYWGLIEARPDAETGGGRTNGYWRVTEKGQQFVRGETTVPSYILLWNNEPVGVSPKEIDIQAALAGGGFDYAEVMGEAA